ncbi:putative C-type lectin domain family 20 member A isoform X1 [Silurus meridionalis]|uniref:putative C-type lectin domain family 20 member A isoform X1 n=1 Tax=Silurus meridionalis TaxID=175797 RepID=UPI001EEB0A7E|nr:putative C-type lectin domain family 20 member A isoform X1 [Silurus meridionalis]
MNLTFCILLGLTGLVPVAVSILGTVPHNYELIKTPMTWADAKNYCRVWYTDLAAIQSGTDWLRLKKEAVSKGLATNAWVGLYADINGWRWSLNNLQYVPFRQWNPGEPNNGAGKESCVAMGIYNNWWDAPCTQLRPIICYNDNLTGSARFIAIPRPYMTWPEAQAYCRTHYTDLASIFNSSDNNIVGKINPGGAWIGLYREPWRWSDRTSALNLSWAAGQPDNYGGIENCAVVNNRLFSDAPCSNQYYFFCHTNFPTRSQTVRLQVKSDGSVFDPALQAFILEQMKQKLEENGMLENTTMIWKVQPDGNIFNKKKKDHL